MKQLRTFLALVGATLVLCQTQAHAADAPSNPMDILRWETFGKLPTEEKVIVLGAIRQTLASAAIYARTHGEDAAYKSIKNDPLLALFETPAFASPIGGDTWFCKDLGFYYKKQTPTEACKTPASAGCKAGKLQCNEVLFGPGICAPDTMTDQCLASSKSKYTDQDLVKYIRDKRKEGDLIQLGSTLGQACSIDRSPTCDILAGQLKKVRPALKSYHASADTSVAAPPSYVAPRERVEIHPKSDLADPDKNQLPLKPVDVASSLPNLQDPAMQLAPPPSAQTNRPPVPPPPPATPVARDDKFKAALDRERQPIGTCDQWNLNAMVDPDSRRGGPEEMVLSFEDAQQLVCEHVPLSPDILRDAEAKLGKRLKGVTHAGKGGKLECNNKNIDSDGGSNCDYWLRLAKNLNNCVSESAKRAPDHEWARAVVKQPNIVVMGATQNGNDVVRVHLLAGYPQLSADGAARGYDARIVGRDTTMFLNGKYMSGELRAYHVGICDVRRDGFRPRPNESTSPQKNSGSGGSVDASNDTPPSSRAPASEAQSTPPAAGWTVPNLPQGAPGTAGGRPTSGQSSDH